MKLSVLNVTILHSSLFSYFKKSLKDDVWIQKNMRHGWYLPYTPKPREQAAWKTHYVECVMEINATPMSKVF